MPRAGVRSSYAGYGGQRVHVEGAMRRRCPKCGAAPGWRCGRYVGAVWEPNKGFHVERKTAGGGTSKGVPPGTAQVLVSAVRTQACVALMLSVGLEATADLLRRGGRDTATALPVGHMRRSA